MAYRHPGALPQKAAAGDILMALHDFQARSDDELSLSKGDRIELMERDDEFGDGWYLGRHLKSSLTGLFPEVYTAIAPKSTAHDSSLRAASAPTTRAVNGNYSSNAAGRAVPSSPTVAVPPLNTFSSNNKPISVSNPNVASAGSTSSAAQRGLGMVHQDSNRDSPVLNETLSVINEHITDMSHPRSPMPDLDRQAAATDSGSEYSALLENRVSYIAGQETDEEEAHVPTEKDILSWNPKQVSDHLEELGVDIKHCKVFREQEITGEVLLALDQASIFMKEFDLGLVGQRLRTWQKIKALQDEVASQAKTTASKKKGGMNSTTKRPEHRKNRSMSSSAAVHGRVPPSPGVVDMDLALPSPSLHQVRDMSQATMSAGTTPTSFAFKSGLDSPIRPSAASVREMNHSRRHSAADFGGTATPGNPTELAPPMFSQNSAASTPNPTQHKKTPSLDQGWTMSPPRLNTGSRPMSQIGGIPQAPDRPPFDPDLAQSSHPVPPSPRDAEDDSEGKKARNVLRKRDTMLSNHSRSGSMGVTDLSGSSPVNNRLSLVGNRRHSRFGSVDSIKDTVAALAGTGSRVVNFGHRRNSSASEALNKSPTSPLDNPLAPAVTRLDGVSSNRQSTKLATIAAERDSSVELNSSARSSSQDPLKSPTKAKTGLRAISDAVASNEKPELASPALSEPTPAKLGGGEEPARTGSTTPSGASQTLDRESTDASSKGGVPVGIPAISANRKKTKRETSAYTRGLEAKAPKEQMDGCDYSGWMKKKSSNLMATWKPRLFILRGRRLSYYYSEDDTQEKGLIDISGHRVLPADNDFLTGLHATVTRAKSTPVSPAMTNTPTLAATEAAAAAQQDSPHVDKTLLDEIPFIFKLVPPRSGLSRAVNFTKPMIHYFAVDNLRQGRLWMAALMKATIDRDETKPVITSYQQKTISLAKARTMQHRPPDLMQLDDTELAAQGESDDPDRVKVNGTTTASATATVTSRASKTDGTGLNISGLSLDNENAKSGRSSGGGSSGRKVDGKHNGKDDDDDDAKSSNSKGDKTSTASTVNAAAKRSGSFTALSKVSSSAVTANEEQSDRGSTKT